MSILDPIRWLEGKWKGQGSGGFPTMDSFIFESKMTFACDAEGYNNEPLIHFEEIAWVIKNDQKEFIHWESGFFKPAMNDTIQFYVCHNTGRIETMYGYFKSFDMKERCFELILNSNHIRNDEGTAVALSSQRIFTFKEDTLSHKLSMATTDVEESTHHLETKLKR